MSLYVFTMPRLFSDSELGVHLYVYVNKLTKQSIKTPLLPLRLTKNLYRFTELTFSPYPLITCTQTCTHTPLKITYQLRDNLQPCQIYEQTVLTLLSALGYPKSWNKPGFPPRNTGGWEKENQETVRNFSQQPKAARSFFIETRKTYVKKEYPLMYFENHRHQSITQFNDRHHHLSADILQ